MAARRLGSARKRGAEPSDPLSGGCRTIHAPSGEGLGWRGRVALAGRPSAREYANGYRYRRSRPCGYGQSPNRARTNPESSGSTAPSPLRSAASEPRVAERGLTAGEETQRRDSDATILDAEDRVEQCIKATEDPAVGGDHVEAQKLWEELESARKQVEALYARWEELESRVI